MTALPDIQGAGKTSASSGLPGSMVVCGFPVFVDVQTFLFHSLVHAQPDRGVSCLEQDESDRCGECYGKQSGDDLYEKLVPVSVKRALDSVFTGYRAGGEHTCQDRSDYTAYAMDSECVQGVVISEPGLCHGYHAEAYC